jgi:hypothetical protein
MPDEKTPQSQDCIGDIHKTSIERSQEDSRPAEGFAPDYSTSAESDAAKLT